MGAGVEKQWGCLLACVGLRWNEPLKKHAEWPMERAGKKKRNEGVDRGPRPMFRACDTTLLPVLYWLTDLTDI